MGLWRLASLSLQGRPGGRSPKEGRGWSPKARRLEPQGSPKEEPVLQIVAGGLFPREGQSCLYACLPLVA